MYKKWPKKGQKSIENSSPLNQTDLTQGWGQIRFIKYKYKYKNLDFSNTNTNTNILFQLPFETK